MPAWLVAGSFIALSLEAGCSRRLPTVAPVSGRVTLAGKPVSTGMVMFHPAHGRAAIGEIDSDGRYTLTTFHAGDGALPGRHQVTIEARTSAGGSPAPWTRSPEEELRNASNPYPSDPLVRWIVPEVYASRATTPLSTEVKPGDNVLDFALP